MMREPSAVIFIFLKRLRNYFDAAVLSEGFVRE